MNTHLIEVSKLKVGNVLIENYSNLEYKLIPIKKININERGDYYNINEKNVISKDSLVMITEESPISDDVYYTLRLHTIHPNSVSIGGRYYTKEDMINIVNQVNEDISKNTCLVQTGLPERAEINLQKVIGSITKCIFDGYELQVEFKLITQILSKDEFEVNYLGSILHLALFGTTYEEDGKYKVKDIKVLGFYFDYSNTPDLIDNEAI